MHKRTRTRPHQSPKPAAPRCDVTASQPTLSETGPNRPVSFFLAASSPPCRDGACPVSFRGWPSSVARRSHQKSVAFLFLGNQSFRQPPPVVLGHAVFPLEEIGDALRFNPDFHPPQTRQQKIHLVLKPNRRPQVLRRRLHSLNLAPAHLQQTPTRRQFLGTYQPPRRQAIPLASDANLRLQPERLVAIRQEIRARHLALHQHRVARLFPPDSIRHLATDASLLAKHHSAAIAQQPSDRHRN